MATTDPDLMAAALDSLSSAGVRFAILHGEEKVVDGTLESDVDIVSDHSPIEMLSKARTSLRSKDIHPILVWPYDVGSASIFFVNGVGSEGTQLDVVRDRTGLGRYGIRADAFLGGAESSERWPVVRPEDRLLYLLRKRLIKGQMDAAAELVDRCNARLGDHAPEVAARLFSPSVAQSIVAALRDQDQATAFGWRARRSLGTVRRMMSRVASPVGFWVAVVGHSASERAELISSRLGRVLPVARRGTTSGSLAGLTGDIALVFPVRIRAGVVATTGLFSAVFEPDVVLDSDRYSEDDAFMSDVVDAMRQRVCP